MSDVLNQKFQNILSTQYTILTVIEKRFSVLKFIYDEYQNDNKGTFNSFIIETMHVYRKSIIIDLCKLYITPNLNPKAKDIYKGNSQNNNFYFTIYTYKNELDVFFYVIDDILSSLVNEVKLISQERDKELAHKDSSTGTSVRMYLKNIAEIEILVYKAREIVEILYKSKGAGIDKIDFQNNSLKKIINFLKVDKETEYESLISKFKNKDN